MLSSNIPFFAQEADVFVHETLGELGCLLCWQQHLVYGHQEEQLQQKVDISVVVSSPGTYSQGFCKVIC
jgi:hypothetical protein